MAEIKNKEPENKVPSGSSNQLVKNRKFFEGNNLLWIVFIFILVLNFLLIFFLFKSSKDLLQQKNFLVLEENLNKEGFNKDYINEAQAIKKVFLDEKQTIDFLAKLNGMGSSFDSLSLKFESSEPILNLNNKSLPFILEVSGTTKAVNLLLSDLLNSSCQFKVNSLLIESKDTFLNSAKFLLKAELLVTDEY